MKMLSSRLFLLVLIVFTIYSVIFIAKTSFVVNGERYFCLFDDAMISMRYAHNLAEGFGPVWNAGEKVEGYTNLLWTFYMALLHLTGITASKASLLVQITSFLCLLINLIFVKKIMELLPDSNRIAPLLAVLLTAFYYPIVNWSLQGMEVGALLLAMTVTLFLGLRQVIGAKGGIWMYVIPGAAILIRLDAVVFFVLFVGLMIYMDRERWRKHLVYGGGILFIALASQTLWRVLYYGDFLPNTYYLKMTGYPIFLRMTRGLYVFLKFAGWMNWVFAAVIWFCVLKRDRFNVFFAVPVIGQILYSIYVGGDACEQWTGCNRFICLGMPCFFMLFARGTANFLLRFHWRNSLWPVAVVSLAAVIQINMFHGPRALGKWLLLRPPIYVDQNKEDVKTALLLENVTDATARIAVVRAGALPYFCARPMIDLLGKSDRYIARLKMRMPAEKKGMLTFFFPGHLKWDYAYSIGFLKPDVVVRLWDAPWEGRAILNNDYSTQELGGRTFYLRKNDPAIRWDKLTLGLDKTPHIPQILPESVFLL